MSNVTIEPGQRFERLTVVKRHGSDDRGASLWLCKCDCGKLVVARGSNMMSGHVRSCGCLQAEHARTAARGKFGSQYDRRNGGKKQFSWQGTKGAK
jgi:hypothetical protein